MMTSPWLMACGVLCAAAAQSQSAPFRASAEAVMVEVSVQEGSRPLTGLTIGDFEVRDNGVSQKIVGVTYGTMPIDVTVALDVSYSVSGVMLDRLRRAVGQLLRDLGPDDRLRLMMFNARVARILDYSKDPAAVDRAMQQATGGGGTALRDAINLALVSSAEPGRRQLLVVFTDGNDASSTTSMELLMSVAQRTSPTVTIVMPSLAVGTFAAASGPMVSNVLLAGSAVSLTALAASTGGSVVPFQPTENIGLVFQRVLHGFRSTYVLHFIPEGVDRSGFHELLVSVTRPRATVTARRGYYGG
jgi:VWFA-related protein